MNNLYRKTFQYDYAFPFTYLYSTITSIQHELPDHVHDWYELVYIHSGRGTFFIDHTFFDAEAGDIFLIPGNTIHRSFPFEEDPKLSSALYFSASLINASDLGDSFSYLQPFTIAKQKGHYRINLPYEIRMKIEELISQTDHEYKEKLVGYRQAIKVHLQQMLLTVNRALITITQPNIRPNYTLSDIPQWMSDIVTYIDSNPQSALSLTSLAKQVNVSSAHFSRVFKRFSGMTVTDYVNTKRILLAKELLLQENSTIAVIGEQCGFSSVPHFHRKFKQVTGMTPIQYKHLQYTQ